MCYTTRDFGVSAKEGEAPQPLLALAIYDPKGDDQKIIRLLLPPGLMLKPGFRFSIDKGAPESGAFEICFPNGCFAEAKVKKAVVDGMKKAEKMTVVVKNQANGEVTFYLPLANFGKAFDGPAVDPKVLEEQQKKLQEELQKKGRGRAQEARGPEGRRHVARAGRFQEVRVVTNPETKDPRGTLSPRVFLRPRPRERIARDAASPFRPRLFREIRRAQSVAHNGSVTLTRGN